MRAVLVYFHLIYIFKLMLMYKIFWYTLLSAIKFQFSLKIQIFQEKVNFRWHYGRIHNSFLPKVIYSQLLSLGLRFLINKYWTRQFLNNLLTPNSMILHIWNEIIHCSTGHISLWGMQGVNNNNKKKPQGINMNCFVNCQ